MKKLVLIIDNKMSTTTSLNEIIYPTKEYILKAHEEALIFGGA